MKSKFKLIIGLAILFVCLGVVYHIAFYGFKLSSCAYTDESLPIPESLKKSSFFLEKDIYLAKGEDKQICSPLLKDIKNELVRNEVIGNVTVGIKYFMNNRQTVESLSKGKTFTIEKIVTQTKHGLSTIDSGSGPFDFLILKDNNGVLYQVATVYLGGTPGKINLTYLDNDEKKALSFEYFNHILYGKYDFDWENSQKYVP